MGGKGWSESPLVADSTEASIQATAILWVITFMIIVAGSDLPRREPSLAFKTHWYRY